MFQTVENRGAINRTMQQWARGDVKLLPSHISAPMASAKLLSMTFELVKSLHGMAEKQKHPFLRCG